jgi:uncharacterized protein
MAGGARRRSRIAGRAQQRIDYTLDRLRRAGYVRTVRALGAGGSADPLYEIADVYLAHWFAVLRDDADLIEGGQGSAVQRPRVAGRRISPECSSPPLGIMRNGWSRTACCRPTR